MRRIVLAAMLLIATAAPALAHPASAGAGGFGAGLLHPFGGLDHLLALVAVGLLAGRDAGARRWRLPVLFAAALLLGMLATRAGFTPPPFEFALAASLLVLGGLLAAGRRLPTMPLAVLAGGFALLHGHAHGYEMPAGVSAFAYGAGLAFTSLALPLAGSALILLSGQRLRGALAPGLRLAGLAIAATGLVLAAA